jgi:hypothetical protein
VFKPGQSGNPRGRPPLIDDIHALAREHAPAAIKALVDALRDKDRAIPAAIALLDRGYGRPPQAVFAHVNGTLHVGGIDAPPRESLEVWLERRKRELDALEGPQPEHASAESASPSPAPSAPSPPPNGQPAMPASFRPAAAPAERMAEPPGASSSTERPTRRSLTEEEARWSRQERRRLGIEPD